MEDKVVEFITEFSAEPRSLANVFVHTFAKMVTVGDPEDVSYYVDLKYKLTSNKGNVKKLYHQFIFNKQMELTSIYEYSKSDPNVSYGISEEWFDYYGRRLSKRDSFKLELLFDSEKY